MEPDRAVSHPVGEVIKEESSIIVKVLRAHIERLLAVVRLPENILALNHPTAPQFENR
jgi:hypothetical protein